MTIFSSCQSIFDVWRGCLIRYFEGYILFLTSSKANLFKEVDNRVFLELFPPRSRVEVDVVALAAAVYIIWKNVNKTMLDNFHPAMFSFCRGQKRSLTRCSLSSPVLVLLLTFSPASSRDFWLCQGTTKLCLHLYNHVVNDARKKGLFLIRSCIQFDMTVLHHG